MVKYIFDEDIRSTIKIIYEVDDSLMEEDTPWWRYRRSDENQNKDSKCYPQFNINKIPPGFKIISKEDANKLCKMWYIEHLKMSHLE